MVQILDTTLREGEQTPGVYFDRHIKLAIADLLDDMGIDIIETGHPMVTPQIHDAVRQIAHRGLRAEIGAHARSLKADIDMALECGVDFLGIFYCVSDARLDNVFNKNLSSAIDQIADTIAYAKEQKPELSVRYTPEDTVRSQFDNVLQASIAAVQAGADIISIADTTGYMIPGSDHNFYAYVSELREAFTKNNLSPRIAVHCHNDRGLALANALDAVRAGAQIVDASVLGLGERAGIVDLAQLLVALHTHNNEISHWRLEKMNALYALVSRYSGVPVPAHFPVMGSNAFTHCAGVHTHAAIKNPTHYQSLDPLMLGREMRVALDHMSGISSLQWALERLELAADNELLQQLLNSIKSIGQKGRIVDLTELQHLYNWHTKQKTRQEAQCV